MKRWFTSIVLLVFALFVGDLKAQDKFDKKKLDDYFSQLEENNKAMCGVAIVKDGKLVYDNYIGFASVESKIKNSASTEFRIGSITKMFTAVMIFQLIEEGKLSLKTRLSEFYPQISNSEKITISDMLSHRSGIHNFTNDEEYQQYMTFKKTKEEMLEIFSKMKPDFQPGKKTEYSNSNYVLLGYILEKITNSTYAKELEKRITGKIGLKDTYYGGKIDTAANEAASYRFEDGKWVLQPETDMSIPHGAGAIVSTPEDLCIFITSLFNNKLVSEKSLKQMKEIRDGLGRGLIKFNFGDKVAYGHNGGIDGFVSSLGYFPDEKIAASLLANGLDYNLNDIAIGVLSIYFNVPFDIPDFKAKEVKLDVEELDNYEGIFSTKKIPLKITLSVKDGKLYGQATGQQSFPLTPYSKTEFRFDMAGVVIKFNENSEGKIEYGTFTLKQHGQEIPFTRE
jgi:D-alanyl-D-alanine carboxypeptidase